MIASVQYNDLRGTAAADVSDFLNNSLQKYLEEYESYDSNRYFCTGCKLWLGGQGRIAVSISFICWDNKENKYVFFIPKNSMSIDDIIVLFKRFEIVIGKDVNEIEISTENYFDLE